MPLDPLRKLPPSLTRHLTRANIPLLVAAIAVLASIIVAIVIIARPDPVETPVAVPLSDIKEPSSAADADGDDVDDMAEDSIGDLIAALPRENQPVPEDVIAEQTPPAVPEGVEHPAWKRFAVASTGANGAQIAIVIDDVGLNRGRARDLIALPAPLTLAFLPYAEGLEALTGSARDAGHELMVHMPMEPIDDSVDPGPHALKVGLSDDELTTRLAWNLDRFDGFVGFNNHMGSRFTADDHGMAVVMADAKKRGLMFLDSRTTGKTKGRVTAERYAVPILERDIFLDNVIEEKAIRTQLDKAVQIAREKGTVIVIGHPHRATINVLREWLKDTGDVSPVPLTALMERGPAILVDGEAGYTDKSGY